jgi:hypothetical protein
MSDWALSLVSLIVGTILGYGIKVAVDRSRISGTGNLRSDQRNSKVRGDQAGRDINKK